MVKAFVAAVAVLLVVAASTAAAQQPEFVAGMLSTVPSGYALASLADLQSADFLNQYNSVGINYVQPFSSESGYICCVVSVQEGYLSIGPSVSFSSYITPFLNGVETCTSNTMPTGTTFGVPSFAPGPYEGMWISNLTTKEQAGFLVTSVTPTGAFSNCGLSGVAATAIYRVIPPKYIVQIVGTGAPAPPGYAVATLADLQSAEFQSLYNKAGGVIMAASPNNQISYCCILSVSEGWVGYNDAVGISPLGLYSETFNSDECGYNQARQLVYIGTPFGGPNANDVFHTLNASVVSLLGTFTRQNTSDCPTAQTSQTLLKRVSTTNYVVQIVGTGAPVPSGFAVATLADLQSVDFQTSYNTAGGVVMAASPNNQNSYCCILSVSEGWVGYNDAFDSISPLGLYSEALNSVECGYNQARQLVFIGTPFGGPNGGFVFRTFNASLVSLFGTFTRQNTSDCQSSPTTQTLLKSVV